MATLQKPSHLRNGRLLLSSVLLLGLSLAVLELILLSTYRHSRLLPSSFCRQAAPTQAAACGPEYPAVPFSWHPPGKVLALTFDDGPHPAAFNSMLDVLRAEGNVPAAFFVNTADGMVGDITVPPFHSKPVQDVLRRLLDEGQELGSHVNQHVWLTQLTAEQLEHQLLQASRVLSRVTGQRSVPLFRAPYGAGFSPDHMSSLPFATVHQVLSAVRQHHVHVGWSFDGGDWFRGGGANCSERLFAAYGPRLVEANATGPVLMHAVPWGMGGCPEALQRLIRYWRAAGYSFVKVSTLVEQLYGRPPAEVVQRAQRCYGDSH